MSTVRRVALTVAMDVRDGDGLLRLVSVFHRRQVEILDARYSGVGPHRWMVATVETTDAQLHTLEHSLRNTIGVTGYEVSPALTAEPTVESDRGVPQPATA